MSEPNAYPGIPLKRKKRIHPLSSLRTSEAVKKVSDTPKRLGELLLLLDDRDISIRGRASAALAQLSLLHPARLIRPVSRLREGLMDESAYVRWHLVCVLGMLHEHAPNRLKDVLIDIAGCLDDPNKIVRYFASKVLAQAAHRYPRNVEEIFRKIGREVHPSIAGILNNPLSEPRTWREGANDSEKRTAKP